MEPADSEIQFTYKMLDRHGHVLLTVAPPGARAVPVNFTATSDISRRTAFNRVRELMPGLDVEVIHNELDRIAVEVAAKIMNPHGDGNDPDGSDGSDGRAPNGNQAEQIVALASADEATEFFHTPGRQDAAAYATFVIEGHRETWSLDSKVFRLWLKKICRDEFKSVPGTQPLNDAIETLKAKALFDGEARPVALRIAGDADTIWIDACDEKWHAIKVTKARWEIVESTKVEPRFIRRSGMLPLPLPVCGGSIDELRPLVNITDDDEWRLFITALVSDLRPRGPYPILAINGEQGSAKSTTSRNARSLIDPNKAALRRPPRDERDLMIAANNGWMVAFDNLSGLPPSLSDALCCLATGGGFGTRLLYSDDEERLFEAQRPVLLNGIEDLATRPDLLDRAILLTLSSIPDEDRKEEAEMLGAFEVAKPRIFGAMLSALSLAMRNLPHTKTSRLPRMADFARFGMAMAPALLWKPNEFLDAYEFNRDQATAIALESSLVARAVAKLMEMNDSIEGIAEDLLGELGRALGDENLLRRKEWPQTGRGLSGWLRRLAPSLRRTGIDIEFHRATTSDRDRLITLKKVRGQPSEPSEPSDFLPSSADGAGISSQGSDGPDGSDGHPPTQNELQHEGSAGSGPPRDGDLQQRDLDLGRPANEVHDA